MIKFVMATLILASVSVFSAENSCRTYAQIVKFKVFQNYDNDNQTGDILVNLYDVNPVDGPSYQMHKDLHKGDAFAASMKKSITANKKDQWVSMISGMHEFIEKDGFIYIAAGANDHDATWFSIDDPILLGSDESHHTPYALNTLHWTLERHQVQKIHNKLV
jgi:hypothetical protein